MGRFPVDKNWSSKSKLKNFMILLRRSPACQPIHLDRYSSITAPQISTFACRAVFTNVKRYRDICVYHLLGHDFFNKVKGRQVVRWHLPSTCVGAQTNCFEMSSHGACPAQSLNQLCQHIKIYFPNKDLVSRAGSVPAYFSQTQRRCQSQLGSPQRPLSEAPQSPVSESNDATAQSYRDKQKDLGLATQENAGLQLFHISSLATRFGESYNYVATHINSVFLQAFAKLQVPEKEEMTKRSKRRPRRRKTQSHPVMYYEDIEMSHLKSSADQAAAQLNHSRSWEEGYRQFARHINSYFGAKAADDAHLQRQPESSPQLTSRIQGGTTQHEQDPISPESGLFHCSHNSVDFRETKWQMSSHMDHHLHKTSRNLKEETDWPAADRPEAIPFMDCFRHPTRAIPDLLRAYLNRGPKPQDRVPKPAMASPEAAFSQKLFLSHKQAEEALCGLMENLRQASSAEGVTTCVEMLNEHLRRHPPRKALMWQEKTAVTLLRQRRFYRDNQDLQTAIREALALIGYVDPVKGHGIKVLSIDGGGTRGVVPLQVLKLLEAQTGKKIHQLFDYICGVSTGAVLAFMLGLAHFSLDECADMYRRFGSEVFRQNRLVGAVKMGWSHSYYNTETWETILREKLGDGVLIKTARHESSPKVSAVSAVVNWGTSPKAFIFCNYNHRAGSLSRYAGGSGYPMWQAVRASSAAPGYFKEFLLQSDIHQDGGIIMNNPCALAVHESRLLWPKDAFQCVLSLGTGRYDNAKRGPATCTSLRAKISNLISSATDTEGVHTLLDDLLPADVYFRFNPMLSAEVSLDESHPGSLDQLEKDTRLYLERNRLKLARLCLVLGAERSAVKKTKDWISERAWEMKHRWV
ncbi:calcium-independent phospholipase A2-gamma-like isoform X2 [Hippocampus zosterae]|uniref:calcium-independent phospholipase A2-gamma-like isoform X2 n=1 Tax=Hippocampus zosterae TaxID=109293 RepID=UPI00223CC8CC|nr:calcium-independent phospholipase A2-gamma-like isoform X2 [Hippocampus zosterae]